MNRQKEFLWCESYRPQTVADCILPEGLTKTFQDIVDSGEIPNMILNGTAGLGKTTIAKAICKELGSDFLMINGSEENGIDVLRNKIKKFASSVSLSGGLKVVIIDEADYLNAQSTQPALRGFIEEFNSNCRFILTCNYKNRIIVPLHSRCSVIDFNTTRKDLQSLAKKFLTRMETILNEEGVSFNRKVLVELIVKFAPDWRRVINECQRFSTGGELNISVLNTASDESVKSLVSYLKDKDFKSMREWVASNPGLDGTSAIRAIYDSMNQHMKPQSVPQAVLILADYSYKASFVSDKELNLVACMVELMSSVEWK